MVSTFRTVYSARPQENTVKMVFRIVHMFSIKHVKIVLFCVMCV